MHIFLALLNTLVGGLLIRRVIRIADGTVDPSALRLSYKQTDQAPTGR
jgi:hypothetical protein